MWCLRVMEEVWCLPGGGRGDSVSNPASDRGAQRQGFNGGDFGPPALFVRVGRRTPRSMRACVHAAGQADAIGSEDIASCCQH